MLLINESSAVDQRVTNINISFKDRLRQIYRKFIEASYYYLNFETLEESNSNKDYDNIITESKLFMKVKLFLEVDKNFNQKQENKNHHIHKDQIFVE